MVQRRGWGRGALEGRLDLELGIVGVGLDQADTGVVDEPGPMLHLFDEVVAVLVVLLDLVEDLVADILGLADRVEEGQAAPSSSTGG